MSTSNFLALAAARYHTTNSRDLSETHRLRLKYAEGLRECKLQPAYHIQLPGGDLYPCVCEPFMDDDAKGWQVVNRRSRVKRVKTQRQLDEEADINNWEDVEHYGASTYVNTTNYEHNGSLFDIGSRF